MIGEHWYNYRTFLKHPVSELKLEARKKKFRGLKKEDLRVVKRQLEKQGHVEDNDLENYWTVTIVNLPDVLPPAKGHTCRYCQSVLTIVRGVWYCMNCDKVFKKTKHKRKE